MPTAKTGDCPGRLDADGTWHPRDRDMTGSQVAAMIRAAGCADFDEMRARSLADPEDYWRRMTRHLGIVWRRDYDRLCDLSRGPEFPDWFVGGALNWTDTALQWADRPDTADKPAIVAESEDGSVARVSYRELRDLVRRLAAGLRAEGIQRGDRIGLLMENGIEASATVLAISHLGAIVVPLFSGFGVDPIVARLGDAGATALIATEGFLRRGTLVSTAAVLDEVLTRLSGIRTVIRKHAAAGTQAPASGAAILDWHAVAASTAAPFEAETMSPDDPFMVIYTSGTTGKPKGAVHTHGGFPVKIAHDAAQNFDVGQDSTFCWPADMGWIAGPLILCAAILRGAALVTYDGAPDMPDWSRMSRLIERHGVTHFGSTPTLIRGFAANRAQATAGDLSRIHLLITAGESIAPEHFLWFQQNFGRGEAPVINYTGGTEVSGGILSSVVVKPIRPAGFNAASAGLAADVVDAKGQPVTGEIGELAIRAPFIGMTRSFWQDDARYLDTYWSAIPGLWVHGDLAMRDASGTFFLMGRSDDTMKIAGKRVGPAEVEEIIVELPDVTEAAVIGVDDALKGQAIVAFITGAALQPSDDLTRTIRQRVQDRLGRPFAPREVHVVSDLPKTQSTKVMRRMIRNVYAGRPLGDTTSLVNPSALEIIADTLADHRGRNGNGS